MANNNNSSSDDFLEQILGYNNNTTNYDPNLGRNEPGPLPMMLQLGSTPSSAHLPGPYGVGAAGFPLGLSLDQGNGAAFGDDVSRNIIGHNLFTTTDDVVHSRALNPGFHGQTSTNPVPVRPHQPTARPRTRARRGQATDPHSIAERLRRERIAERVRALQDLVPSVNKTDRATMLNEIVDYVKFLRLQVKVLSMSRLGGAAAVAPLVSDIPTPSVEDERINGLKSEAGWEKWSKDGTEEQVAKLMEEDVGAAMQYLQSKGLCIMPVSLASAIYPTHTPDSGTLAKPESDSF